MEAAGSERATLLAHGRAAQMALLFAATHPERVDSLVLLNGFARLSRADDYPVGMPAAVQASVLEGDRRALGNRAMATLLGPSLASRPGVRDWYGRVERDAAGPGTFPTGISSARSRSSSPGRARPTRTQTAMGALRG
ncbi:MAG: alpha/beta hydrolase [Actinobacteria bacterium]|nr:MAG: alpha/beta hydrolase [Actinomycetota bacterium]